MKIKSKIKAGYSDNNGCPDTKVVGKAFKVEPEQFIPDICKP